MTPGSRRFGRVRLSGRFLLELFGLAIELADQAALSSNKAAHGDRSPPA